MDCRKSLLLILSLGIGSGCTTTTGKGPPSQPPLPSPVPLAKAKEKPGVKQNPKADTCVAFGQCFERAASTKEDLAQEQNIRDNARLAYQQALQTDANNLDAWAGLARVYTMQGDFERALETYNKALQKFPTNAPLWDDLAMCHARRKDWPQAIRTFQKAVELDPENRQYNQHLGFCLARSGQMDESVACLQRVMGPALAHYNVARMLHHLKQDDRSRHHLQLALQADPNLADAQNMLAHLEQPPNPQGVVQTRNDE